MIVQPEKATQYY